MTTTKTAQGEVRTGEGVKPIRNTQRAYRKKTTGPGHGRIPGSGR